MLIAQTSHLFKEVSESSETTAALQADFLQSLAAHSQNLATAAPTPVPGSPLPNGALDASMSGGMNGNALPDHFDWFDAMGNFEPFPETVSPINRAMMPSAEVQSSWTAPASLLPHILEGTDLGNLDDAQWDQVRRLGPSGRSLFAPDMSCRSCQIGFSCPGRYKRCSLIVL